MSNPYNAYNQDVTVGYNGQRSSLNVTVSPLEVQRKLAAEKKRMREYIAGHQEYRRVKKGVTNKTQMLPVEERVSKNGSITLVKPITTTTRTEH